MNSSRRADLQRKLSLNAVPHPPAGLAEKIKREIPADLSVTSRSSTWGLRAAASIAVLISSVLAAFLLLREPQTARPVVPLPARSKPVPAVASATTTSGETTSMPARLAIGSAPSAPAEAPVAAPAPALVAEFTQPPAFAPQMESARESDFVAGETTGRAEVAIAAAAPEPAAASERAPEPARDALAEQGVAGAVATAPVAARAAAPAFATAQSKSMATATPAPPPPAGAAHDRAPAVASGAFGVSVDPAAFDRVRNAIEAGNRPSRREVDVEALVNYFAGAPARPPREGLRLEVEASPAPLRAGGDHAILRLTVDAPAASSGVAPVARQAEVELKIDTRAVASYRRIGSESPLSREPVVYPGATATAVYELVLKKGLAPSQRVATVRLSWTSPADGTLRATEKQILGRDLASDWTRASRRHRLASLGAFWGETLRGTAGGYDVAREAEELATQDPEDHLARQLANVASASSRLPGSRPTGSGR